MSTSIELIHRPSGPFLSTEALRKHVPAVFATHQFETTGPDYVFISTQELVEALRGVGFHPTDARQRRSRGDRLGYARHMIRFRSEDAVSVVGCTPEVILINSHDATSAWQLRGGFYRFACCNGLIVSLADLTVLRVPHRGNVIASVVQGAQHIMDQLHGVGAIIEQMVRTELDAQTRRAFAQRALEIRYRNQDRFPFDADRLLEARDVMRIAVTRCGASTTAWRKTWCAAESPDAVRPDDEWPVVGSPRCRRTFASMSRSGRRRCP